MGTRLIVPGASGFIGRNLIQAVPADWEVIACYHHSHDFPAWVEQLALSQVSAVQCDLTDQAAVGRLADQVGSDFDACVFLAANGDPAYSVDHPVEDLQANVITVLNFLSHFRVGKFIYFSSGAVYDGWQGPISPGATVSPRLPYAISNWASEHYVRAFTHQGRIGQYVNLRFFGAYGPYEPGRKIYTKLVRRFAFDRQPQFTIRGDGRNYIDAMYVADTIAGIYTILAGDKANLTLDFCSGTPLTINELVCTAARAFDLDPVKIEHIGHVPEYINFYASAEPMARLFDFKPTISLPDGLERLADFLKQSEQSDYA
ncbi:MAG: NAD(P)-dependent oxidoreductase [Anaerolineae bacterium]|nr:NAD(P)-dependent oxidoreductase [Anaerolineae bacterium]